MKIELTQIQLLSSQQISEFASNLDGIHSRVIKAIERLNKDVATKKTEIASRGFAMMLANDKRDRCGISIPRFFKQLGLACSGGCLGGCVYISSDIA